MFLPNLATRASFSCWCARRTARAFDDPAHAWLIDAESATMLAYDRP
jgi:hypothetical protein